MATIGVLLRKAEASGCGNEEPGHLHPRTIGTGPQKSRESVDQARLGGTGGDDVERGHCDRRRVRESLEGLAGINDASDQEHGRSRHQDIRCGSPIGGHDGHRRHDNTKGQPRVKNHASPITIHRGLL